MTSTIAMIRCPYASTVGDAVELEQHPDGLHRCTQTIPASGDHLGQHTCVCGVAFVLGPVDPATVVHLTPADDGVRYLLWSQRHAAWWKPSAAGYTDDVDEAGRFSETDAVRHVVASAQSGIRDKVTFMVAAPDNWAHVGGLRTPDEWQRRIPDVVILDADGWRDAPGTPGRSWDEPITRDEYLERRNRCTITGPAGRA